MFSRATLVTLVPIKNMNRAVKFYTKTLGGKLRFRDKGAMKDFWASPKRRMQRLISSTEIGLYTALIWLFRDDGRINRPIGFGNVTQHHRGFAAGEEVVEVPVN